MFSTVLQELKGYFGRDFLLSAFFPVLFFAGLSLMLYLEITQGVSVALDGWGHLPTITRSLIIVGGIIVVVVLAYLLYNFQYSLIRLFEGYWPRRRFFLWLRNWRVEFYRRRWEYLKALAQSASTPQEANEIWAELLVFYPPPNHVDKMMPTCLGNILRAVEIYPYERYGIDAAVIWPRLRSLLKPEAMALLEDRKTTLMFMLSMSLLSAVFSLIWCPTLAIWSNRWELFGLCALGWPLAWMCYQNALQSALAYGEQLKVTFDLYRHELLRALNRPLPKDAEDERKEWLRLTRFFHRNLPLPSTPFAPTQPKGWDRLAEALAEYLERQNESPRVTNEEEQP
jgi:hypothetical protein